LPAATGGGLPGPGGIWRYRNGEIAGLARPTEKSDVVAATTSPALIERYGAVDHGFDARAHLQSLRSRYLCKQVVEA
jgi:hypothetical protein